LLRITEPTSQRTNAWVNKTVGEVLILAV